MLRRPLMPIWCLILTLGWAMRGADAASYPISHFDQLRGLVVVAIYQDSKGYIWLATESGLWRGHTNGFEPITAPAASSKPLPIPETWGKQGKCLLEDDDGTLWIGTDFGLIALDVESLEPRPVPESLRSGNIFCLVRNPAGGLWAGTNNGLYHVRVQDRTAVAECLKGTKPWRVYSATAGDSDDLWLGATGALLHIQGGQVQRYMEDRIGQGPVSLLRATDGTLWIGLRSSGGLYRMTAEQPQRMTKTQGLLNDDVNAIIQAPNGDIWVGTEDGAFRWTGKTFIGVDHSTGLENTDVHSILADSEGQIWIGTFGGGACQIRSPDILTYGVDDGLAHTMVTTLAHGPQGRLLIGTVRSAGYFDPKTTSEETIEPRDNIRVIHVDQRKQVWVGSQHHIWREGETKRFYVPGRIFSIGDSPEGDILVGTSGGLHAIDGETIQPVRLPGEIRAPIFAIFKTAGGDVYLGTASGLARRRAQGWSLAEGGMAVWSLCQAKDGTLWLGTDRRVVPWRGDQVGQPPQASLTTNSRVNALAIDAEGILWAATRGGLFRLRDGETDHFTLADGLPSNDVRAVLLAEGGILFAGTTQGLARINTKRLAGRGLPPRVTIQFWSSQRMLDRSQDGTLQVPFSKQDILVHVACLGWRSAVGTRYQYQLEGRDTTWSAPTPQSSQRFTDLPPGEYTFRARAVNPRGMVSDVPAEFSFAIRAPFWQEPWFMAAAGGVFLAIALLVRSLRSRRRELVVERRRRETEVRKNEKKFHTLADTISAAAFIFRESRIIYANPAAEAMVEYTREELLGMDFSRVIHPDFKELARQRGLGRQRGETVPDRYEVKIITKTGEARWVDFTAGMIDFDGAPAVLGTAFDITERKSAEEALGLTQFAIDHTSDAAFWVRPDASFIYINDAACSLYGYTREEFLTKGVFDINPTLSREELATTWQENKETGHAIFLVEHQKKNGERFPVELSSNFVQFEGNEYICVFGRDITERRRREEALRESEEWFRTLVEHAPEAVLLLDVDTGKLVDANENAVKLTGRSKEELLKLGPVDISPTLQPDGRPSSVAATDKVRQALRGEAPVFEWTHQRADGSLVSCEIRLVLLPSADRRLIRASITNISQRLRAEKTVRDLATFADENPSPVLRVAADGRILYANPASRPCLETWNCDVGQKLPEPRRQKVLDILKSQTRKEEEIDCAGRTFSMMFTPVPDAGYINLYGRDITQRKRTEEQLRQSQKMEAMGTLASGVAHEFDNLLTAISTYTELAKSTIAEGHQAVRALEKVEQVAKQARGVTLALLTFSHRAVFPKTAVNLSHQLSETARLLGRLLPARIEIVEDIPAAKDLWIEADAGQLQQILMNLALNSRDAMPNGGQLHISLKDGNHTLDRPATEGARSEGNGSAVITVEDTGCGMSERILLRIFEPFYTTKPRGQGTGLGMSLVHGIVEDLGGDIEVRSQPRKGTRITITLPCIAPPEEPLAEESSRRIGTTQGRIILVVERNEHIRSIITSTLRSRGFDVLPTCDVEQAIGAIHRREHLVGLIIMDLDMADNASLKRLHAFYGRREDIPLVVLAGTLSINLEVYGLDRSHVLRKPFQMGRLTTVVDQLLAEAESEEA